MFLKRLREPSALIVLSLTVLDFFLLRLTHVPLNNFVPLDVMSLSIAIVLL